MLSGDAATQFVSLTHPPVLKQRAAATAATVHSATASSSISHPIAPPAPGQQLQRSVTMPIARPAVGAGDGSGPSASSGLGTSPALGTSWAAVSAAQPAAPQAAAPPPPSKPRTGDQEWPTLGGAPVDLAGASAARQDTDASAQSAAAATAAASGAKGSSTSGGRGGSGGAGETMAAQLARTQSAPSPAGPAGMVKSASGKKLVALSPGQRTWASGKTLVPPPPPLAGAATPAARDAEQASPLTLPKLTREVKSTASTNSLAAESDQQRTSADAASASAAAASSRKAADSRPANGKAVSAAADNTAKPTSVAAAPAAAAKLQGNLAAAAKPVVTSAAEAKLAAANAASSMAPTSSAQPAAPLPPAPAAPATSPLAPAATVLGPGLAAPAAPPVQPQRSRKPLGPPPGFGPTTARKMPPPGFEVPASVQGSSAAAGRLSQTVDIVQPPVSAATSTGLSTAPNGSAEMLPAQMGVLQLQNGLPQQQLAKQQQLGPPQLFSALGPPPGFGGESLGSRRQSRFSFARAEAEAQAQAQLMHAGSQLLSGPLASAGTGEVALPELVSNVVRPDCPVATTDLDYPAATSVSRGSEETMQPPILIVQLPPSSSSRGSEETMLAILACCCLPA